MIVDIEKLVTRYLRDHPDVVAIGTRVRATTPSEQTGGTALPWVRVTQLDASQSAGSRADWLTDYLVQFDVYAGATGGQPQVNLHARTIRALLHALPGTHVDGVVTSVRFAGMARVPDSDFEPARERVIVTAEIYAHPVPVAV